MCFFAEEYNKNNNTTMASKVKNIGLLLVVLGAIISILSHFLGWNNSNLINLGSVVMIIAGIITYITASKKLLQE